LGNKYKVPDFQQVTAKNTKISSISRHKNEKNTILVTSAQRSDVSPKGDSPMYGIKYHFLDSLSKGKCY